MSGVEDTLQCSKQLHMRQLFGVYVPAMVEARTKLETVKVVLALDPTALQTLALCGVGQDTLTENERLCSITLACFVARSAISGRYFGRVPSASAL